MANLTTDQLRALLDRVDEEAREAESANEVAELRAELAELRERLDSSDEQRRALEQTREHVADAGKRVNGEQKTKTKSSSSSSGETKTKRTRPGRKRGQVYQDEPGGPGYVYDGDDEPDEVELVDDETPSGETPDGEGEGES